AERVPLRPHPRLLRAQLVVGRDLVLRGAAFQACFLSATAVAGRFSGAALGAHQIAFQLWSFCALVLDAVAIAAQSLGGAALDGVLIGAGDLRFLRDLTIGAALGGFLPAIWLAYGLRLGLGGIWAGLALFVLIRLVAMLARTGTGRWAVVGAP